MVATLPHIDAGGSTAQWEHGPVFSSLEPWAPTEDYGGQDLGLSRQMEEDLAVPSGRERLRASSVSFSCRVQVLDAQHKSACRH